MATVSERKERISKFVGGVWVIGGFGAITSEVAETYFGWGWGREGMYIILGLTAISIIWGVREHNRLDSIRKKI